jgi:hypothetical protein
MSDENKTVWDTFREWLLDFFHGPASGEVNHEQLTSKKIETDVSSDWEPTYRLPPTITSKPKKKKPKKRKKTKVSNSRR